MEAEAVVQVRHTSAIGAGKKAHARLVRFTGDAQSFLQPKLAALDVFRNRGVNNWVVLPGVALSGGDIFQPLILIDSAIPDRGVFVSHRKCRYLPGIVAPEMREQIGGTAPVRRGGK